MRQLAETFHLTWSLAHNELANWHVELHRSSYISPFLSGPFLCGRTNKSPFRIEEQLAQPTGQQWLLKRQVAHLSPRLGILNNISFLIIFELRVFIFRNLVATDMMVRVWTGTVAGGRKNACLEVSSRMDQLDGVNLKEPVEITFIGQFGQDEYVVAFLQTLHPLTQTLKNRASLDGGGVSKEFFTSLRKEVFDTNPGLWLANKKNGLYPNPHSYATECTSSCLALSHSCSDELLLALSLN